MKTEDATMYCPESNQKERIKLNIGGKLFETTVSTAAPSSFLDSLSSSTHPPPFIDRDPEIFSSLLSLLRTHRLPSSTLPHSGQISYYDGPTLSLSSTLRTHLHDISSIVSISPEISVVGSNSFSGLHLYTRENHAGSLYWMDDSDTRVHKSRVTSIADLGMAVFAAAFECRHGENAVQIVDKSTLKVVAEIGRQSGNSAKSTAIKRLRWVPEVGLLVGSAVNWGAFGYSGYVRVWDPRSGEMVWETNEPGGVVRSSRLDDTMADIDVDPEELFLAKVGSKTGDLGVADLRKLGSDPWVYLEDRYPGLSRDWNAGGSVVVHCYKGNVFVGRGGGLEAWSRVADRAVVGDGGRGEREWGVYRRNYVDKVEDLKRGIISKIEGGGNRLFVRRENVGGIEVWETSCSSGVKTAV
uniref:Potassium channel tetramerisation-type BTB domain-containing protein n=1 Tax=Chenopodium quinoa TaxID=63459 RepID=A0A803N835_CHEQI